MDAKATVFEICKRAKDASRDFSVASTEKKNALLQSIASALEANSEKIISANLAST